MSPTSYQTALPRDVSRTTQVFLMAEEEGFEPPHRFHDLSVFKTDPFNRLGIPPKIYAGGPCRTRTYNQPVMSRELCHWAKGPYLVAAEGLEPPTYRVWASRSKPAEPRRQKH